MKKSIKKITIIAILMFIVACLSTQVLAVGKTITQDDLDSTKDEILTEVNTVKTEQQALSESQKNLQQQVNENSSNSKSSSDLGYIAAALATGLGCIGAGIAVALVASSAVGAVSENPSLLGKTIIFAGLAEGIAIYGLIISIMILSKI
jgi:F0F1-type ATP synthase membrane subunit c/vacuolar-type H+-ATPase subunit K